MEVEVLDVEQAPPAASSFDELSEDSGESAEECWDWLLSDDELDVDMLEETVMSGCTCGALRAHTKTCPLNPRARYPTQPLHRPGDYVFLHGTQLKDEHIHCRVIECLARPAANLYRLGLVNCVLAEVHPKADLTKSSSGPPIPLDKWRTSLRITLRVAQNDPCSRQKCECERPVIDKVTIDLTDLG